MSNKEDIEIKEGYRVNLRSSPDIWHVKEVTQASVLVESANGDEIRRYKPKKFNKWVEFVYIRDEASKEA